MRNGWAILGMAAVSANARGQIPDVAIQLNAIGSFVVPASGNSQFRYFSLFGTPSVAALRFSLETGFSGYLSQRLERIPHDGDPDQLDQAYIEDEGIWRLGKQVLPFGSTQVLRESAVAARADLNLPLYNVPVVLALCDSGPGRQRGFVGRIGAASCGLSIALGEHFGISGSSLTQIRLPTESPGIGRGWNFAVGGDFTRRLAGVRLRAEALLLRQGTSPNEPDVSLLDLSAAISRPPFNSILVGYTREVSEKWRIVRFVASLPLADRLTISPYVRFRDARLWDLGFELQLKL